MQPRYIEIVREHMKQCIVFYDDDTIYFVADAPSFIKIFHKCGVDNDWCGSCDEEKPVEHMKYAEGFIINNGVNMRFIGKCSCVAFTPPKPHDQT